MAASNLPIPMSRNSLKHVGRTKCSVPTRSASRWADEACPPYNVALAACPKRYRPFGKRTDAGFTLLEVLVALVVLAVALVALTRTAAIETSQFGAARDRTLAGWVAANALTDVSLQGMPAVGRRSGKVTMAKREWHYRVTVSTTQSSGIRRIHVDVYEPGERAGVDDATPLLGMDGFAGESLQP